MGPFSYMKCQTSILSTHSGDILCFMLVVFLIHKSTPNGSDAGVAWFFKESGETKENIDHKL